MEIQLVAIMPRSSEERAFAIEAYFFNRLSVIVTKRAFRNRFNVVPRDPVPDPLRSCEPGVGHDEELEYLDTSDHLGTLRQRELQLCNLHDVLRANLTLPLAFPIVH